MSRKLIISKEEYQKVIDIYLSGKSIPETAKYFNVSEYTILNILKRCNIARRTVKEGNSLKWENDDFRNNQIEKRKNKPSGALGKTWTIKHRIERLNQKGENNHFWKGGKTKISQQIKNLVEYKMWRSKVFERDKYTCVQCGRKRKEGDRVIVQADHIYPFSKILDDFNITSIEEAMSCEKLWDINNGRTLCVDCHKDTDTWGMNQYTKK